MDIYNNTGSMIEQILIESGIDTVQALRTSFDRNKVNASGRLSKTLIWRVLNEGGGQRLQVEGEGYIFTTEDGRGPTKRAGDGTLKEKLFQWTKDKGIRAKNDKERRGIVNAILFSPKKGMHKFGSKRYRKGGKSGILSSVINDKRVNSIENRIAEAAELEFFEGIVRNTK